MQNDESGPAGDATARNPSTIGDPGAGTESGWSGVAQRRIGPPADDNVVAMRIDQLERMLARRRAGLMRKHATASRAAGSPFSAA